MESEICSHKRPATKSSAPPAMQSLVGRGKSAGLTRLEKAATRAAQQGRAGRSVELTADPVGGRVLRTSVCSRKVSFGATIIAQAVAARCGAGPSGTGPLAAPDAAALYLTRIADPVADAHFSCGNAGAVTREMRSSLLVADQPHGQLV